MAFEKKKKAKSEPGTTFFLNKSKDKKKGDGRPDFWGKLELNEELAEIVANGGILDLSAWIHEKEDGSKFFVVKMQEEYNKKSSTKTKGKTTRKEEEDDDNGDEEEEDPFA